VYIHVYCFFLKQTCRMNVYFLCLLWFVLDFMKLYLFVNCWTYVELPNYMSCDEINNSLFNLLRHNLDVTHIEKNVFENIFNTIMDMKRKTKDNIKDRMDITLSIIIYRHTLFLMYMHYLEGENCNKSLKRYKLGIKLCGFFIDDVFSLMTLVTCLKS
jgi:hypothetical protein